MKGRRHHRGLSLATVLLTLVILASILFVAGSSSISQLQVVSAAARQEQARNLAEGALNLAVARLLESDFQLTSGQVAYQIADLQDAEGLVSFDAAGDFSQRFSVNNLEGERAVSGAAGVSVPAQTVHLVARGRVGETVQWMECLYHRPPFPDGLLASGPVLGQSLSLSGVRRGSSYAGGDPQSLPSSETIPSSLHSNAREGFRPGEESIQLSQQSDISGSVGSVGQVNVDSTTSVAGEILPGSEARPLPDIDLPQRLQNLERNAVLVGNSHGGDLSLDADWFSKSQGGLTVAGDLDLNGSALLVSGGDLRVGGALRGTGIVMVDGGVSIAGAGSSVVSEEQMAIGCTGDFEIDADGVDNNYFQGLIYCEGDLRVRHVTVVGAAVVHGKRGRAGSARLENVRFVYNPGSVELSLMAPRGYVATYGGGFGGDEHVAALSFVRTPSPQGDGFFYNCKLYLTFDADTVEDSEADLPWEWQSNSGEFQDPISFRSPLIRIHDRMSVEEIHQTPDVQDFAALIGQRLNTSTPRPEDDVDWIPYFGTRRDSQHFSEASPVTPEMPLAQALYADLQAEQEEYNLSFSLNKLLTQGFGDSRYLFWRPFEP